MQRKREAWDEPKGAAIRGKIQVWLQQAWAVEDGLGGTGWGGRQGPEQRKKALT